LEKLLEEVWDFWKRIVGVESKEKGEDSVFLGR
jgi:hypothetical protein